MTRPIHRIYQQDGSFIDQPYTDEEMAQLEKDKLTIQKLKQEEADRLSAKADAEAKLAALGLTADDLKALGLA